jgi:hypothetical protein
MLMVPRRVQLTETEARELIKRLEVLVGERASANAISRIQYALTDGTEHALTPSEAAAIHTIVATWLSEESELEPVTRGRLEKLQRVTSPI